MFIRGIYIPKSICLFFEGEAGGGGGGGDNKPPIPDASADLTRRLAAAEGSASVVAQQLANENYQLRVSERNKADEITRLKAETTELNTKLTAAKTPEGSMVLTKEEGVIWEALKAMGKPEDIKAKLDSVPALEKKIADAERLTVVSRAAEAEGYEVEVLTGLVGESPIEFKTVDKKEVPYIKLTENGVETSVRLSEHIEAKHAKYLPALKPAAAKGTHVKQDGPGKPGGTSVYDNIRARQAEKKKQASTDKPLNERLNMTQTA